MALLKNDDKKAGDTIDGPTKFEGVQAGVRLSAALPDDPVKAAARKSVAGVRLGLYRDNSGGVYMVVAVADGHVAYANLNGGHGAPLRTIPVEQFLLKHNGVQAYVAVLAETPAEAPKYVAEVDCQYHGKTVARQADMTCALCQPLAPRK